MAAVPPAGELLRWDIPPLNGHGVYFSREIYEKYSLAPTLPELLLLSKRQAAHSTRDPTAGQENRTPSEQPSGKPTNQAAKPLAEEAPFKSPHVSFPYFSSLTESEQRRYLFLLSAYAKADPGRVTRSQQKDFAQYLQMKEFVSSETAEFLKFAQNVARSCSKDYKAISEEALLYTEKFFSTCLVAVENYPESYTLHEVTSILGGKFSSELTLKFEKCLVSLGKASLVKRHFPKLPAPIQLPDPCQRNELGVATPEQRASALHSGVSTDQNAEKLAAKYGPQAVLSSESLFALLNNQGMDYKEEWELPVSVKTTSDGGLGSVKVVYIDPPLPKKEVTVREKNQLFHEFLMDFHTTKQSSVFTHSIVLDRLSEKPVETAPEKLPARQVQVSDSEDLDFDTDFTELETFGSETRTQNASRLGKAPRGPAGKSDTLLEPLEVRREKADLISGKREGVGEAAKEKAECISEQHFNNPPPPSSDENLPVKCCKAMEVEADGEKVAEEEKTDSETLAGPSERAEDFKERTEEAREDTVDVLSFPSDTDEESLVIETERRGTLLDSPQSLGVETPQSSCSGEVPAENVGGPLDHEKLVDLQKVPRRGDKPGQGTNAPRKVSRQLSKKCDPLGEILKMQTELLKPPSPPSPGPPLEGIPERRNSNPTPSQGCSLSKALEWSSSEPPEKATAEARLGWVADFQGSQTEMLWDGAEDRSEYEPPPQGNRVYKLFRLDGLLLLVRCSVQKVELRPRNKKAKVRRPFPVYVLPKLEYQAFYGAETLTEGEICRLWMESLLHSNSSFEVGHIDALSSQLFLLEQLSAEDLRKRFGTFKPANSLNILQHILKKVIVLPEGSYLLAHSAGDASLSVYKSVDGTSARPAYNLRAAHSDLPREPSALGVPWVPLDPSLPLPHHFAQGRVPCTFPPKPADPQRKQKVSRAKAYPSTPDRREEVAMETHNKDRRTAHPLRKRPGAAAAAAAARGKAATRRPIPRQPQRGPSWKFWKQTKEEP